MKIRHSTPADLAAIQAIYAHARALMKATGNPNQWKDNRPLTSAIENDIDLHQSYVLEQDGEIVGVFSLIFGADPTYAIIEQGQWKSDLEYGAIHKIASSGKVPGIFDAILQFCEARAISLRIDTHPDNHIMQHLILSHGFSYCGLIYTDDGTIRRAYQKDLIEPADSIKNQKTTLDPRHHPSQIDPAFQKSFKDSPCI